MKKVVLGLMFFASWLSGTSYNEVRKEFKQGLYDCQKRLGSMSYSQYAAFIEPFLQESEKTLFSVHYCRQYPSSELCRRYFLGLLEYNVACFNYYIKPNSATKNNLENSGIELLNVIKEIKHAENNAFTSNEEFKKTAHLMYKANVAYYKQLNFQTKALLYFA